MALELVWSDEFDVDGPPDPDTWGNEYGLIRNSEKQFYTDRPENVIVAGGELVITGIEEAYSGAAYTSASLITKGKRAFGLGRIEIRGKFPVFRGSFPAFWFLGTDIDVVGWPDCGEVDGVEQVGFEPTIVHAGGIHTAFSNVSNYQSLADPENYHVYAIERPQSGDRIDFYIDDDLIYTFEEDGSGVCSKDLYLILNLALGGTWAGSVGATDDPPTNGIDNSALPAEYRVQYVRYYQEAEMPSPTITGSPVLLTPGLSATPGAQSIDVPSDATGVVVFMSAASSTGSGVTSLSGNFCGAFTKQELTVADFSLYSIAVLYADVTSTGAGKQLTPVWNQTLEDGPIFMVAFVKDTAASAWVRDIQLDHQQNADASSLTAASAATDLAIYLQAAYNDLPGAPTGCTSVSTQGAVVTEYGRLSTVNTPGASTTTVNAVDNNYATTALITIKAAGTVTLTVANASHGHAAGSPSLVQQNTLAVAAAVHAHLADSPSLTQANVLAVAGAVHAHAASSPSLVQQNTLAVAGAVHAHAASSPSLVQQNTLAVAGAVHAHAASSPSLVQQNTLAVAGAVHAHSAGSPSLIQANVLAVQNTLHAHIAANADLLAGNTLTVAAAVHAHLADSPSLTQANVLAALSALHAHISSTLSLTQANVLAVQNGQHGHAADSPTLSQGMLLAVLNTLHAHTASSPALLQANLLAVANALHVHTAQSPSLSQANLLVVDSAMHAHLVTTVTLILNLASLSRDALAMVPSEDRVSLLPPDTDPRLFLVPPSSTLQ